MRSQDHGSPLRRHAVLLLALLGVLLPRDALAQLDLTSRASAQEVEVGEIFSVEVRTTVDQSTQLPSSPQLRAPAGMEIVGGPSVSTGTTAHFRSGGALVKRTFGATWQLSASKQGNFTIPAPSVSWEGRRVTASPITVRVVPSTGRRQTQRPGFPSLLPGGPPRQFPWPFGGPDPFDANPFGDTEQAEDDPGSTELALPTAPDPTVFLRASTDKTRVVVGEQSTLSFHLYYRESLELTERHEAPMPDFMRVPLLKNPGTDSPTHARAGGRRYEVRLLDKVALFPLKAGTLNLGSMTARITGRRIGSRVLRESNDIAIEVTEPPTDGRPPGYRLGDVGRFSLSAAVQPRQISQGGSVAVTLKVTGSGNFPQTLRVPARTGIEWLDPEKRETLEPRSGVIAGYRSFGYVVRIEESGKVDLGTLEFPYWDPEQRRYVVERAQLGVIDVTPVTPTAAPAASGTPSATPDTLDRRDPFASLPTPRASLTAWTPVPPPRLEGPTLWSLLAAPPFFAGLLGLGERITRRVRERRAAGDPPAKLAADALREAGEAATRGDAKETAAASERAIHRAIEAATGLLSRGILIDALVDALMNEGIDRGTATRARDVLADCDAIRFDPSATAAAAAELVERARTATTELARWKRP
ncbi:BatD family protein [Chondromyces apiculatus]|nr:BatD family protein [Chondromyces apiculatus]